MAGDWIKFGCSTPDKPEVYDIADRLGIDPDAVVGKLIRVWVWADQNCNDGSVTHVTLLKAIDRITSVSGFGEAMILAGWLTRKEDGFSFPNFGRHNGQPAKTRALTGNRVSKNRSKKCNAGSVTNVTPPSLPEKRREEDLERERKPSGQANAKNEPTRPTLTQAKSAAGLAGVTEQEAEAWWHKREATDWMRSLGGNGVGPVGASWQSDLKQWVNGERQRISEAKERRPNGKTQKTPSGEIIETGFWGAGVDQDASQAETRVGTAGAA